MTYCARAAHAGVGVLAVLPTAAIHLLLECYLWWRVVHRVRTRRQLYFHQDCWERWRVTHLSIDRKLNICNKYILC